MTTMIVGATSPEVSAPSVEARVAELRRRRRGDALREWAGLSAVAALGVVSVLWAVVVMTH